MATKNPNELRKKVFINKEIQGRIVFRCAIFWIVYHFLMLHTLFAFEFMQYQIEIINGGSVTSFGQLYSNFLGKYYPFLFTALAIFPILTMDVIKMSHRIVGPLVPFTRTIKQLKNGERVEQVRLRKGDMLVEFQEDFNDFLLWFNSHQHIPIHEGGAEPVISVDAEADVLNQVEELKSQLTDAEAQTVELLLEDHNIGMVHAKSTEE